MSVTWKWDNSSLLVYVNGGKRHKRRIEDPTTIKIMLRDNFACQVCGEGFDGRTAGTLVHHIDGNRTNQAASNLLVLCHTCHGKIHNRSRGRFVPLERRDIAVELRLLELAWQVKYRSKRIIGKGWFLENLNNETAVSVEKFEMWHDLNAEPSATKDSA